MVNTTSAYLVLVTILLFINNPLFAREPVTSLLELRQQNVTMQKWDLSCGAAALTTLLNYQHNGNFTERAVAIEMIGREEYVENPELLKIKQGFSLLDLKRFVDRRGYTGSGYGQLEFENLTELAPVIVPVNFDGYNHFVIFRGTAANRVLLADPAWGNRTMFKDKFTQSWIDFGDIGRVGFAVESDEYRPELNRLNPGNLDFMMIQ